MVDGALPNLRTGELRTIALINGSQLAAKRLADMGFVRGARVMMVRPGAPCIVRIDDRYVGLGAVHQRSIFLSPE